LSFLEISVDMELLNYVSGRHICPNFKGQALGCFNLEDGSNRLSRNACHQLSICSAPRQVICGELKALDCLSCGMLV